MSILTHTHRATQVPDEPTAPLIDKVDTTRTEHNWNRISIVLAVIAALSGVVIALYPPLEDAPTVAATTWPAK